jgi:hypothetical protein
MQHTYSLATKHSGRLALPLSLGRVGACNPYDFPILWQWLGRLLVSWLDVGVKCVVVSFDSCNDAHLLCPMTIWEHLGFWSQNIRAIVAWFIC